jgi:hypothetical protein
MNDVNSSIFFALVSTFFLHFVSFAMSRLVLQSSVYAAPPPSTGKKKAKARRVFGDAVAEETESSLTYSPSPRRAADYTHSNSNSSSNNLSASTSIDTESSEYPSKPSAIATLFEGDNDSDDEEECSEDGRTTRASSSSCGPFGNIIGVGTYEDSTGKENARTTISSTLATDAGTPPKPTSRANTNLRPTRSPLRRDVVKKTQDAINMATDSVNQSLNNARKAKAESYRQKNKETAKVRREWHQDTLEAKSFYRQAEQSRRQMLSLQRQLSSQYSQEKAKHDQNQRQTTLSNVDKESQFKSAVYREHQESLKQEQDRRRRHSTAARAKIRDDHKVGETQIQLQRIEEEQAIFEERHEASVAFRNTVQQNAAQRRKSFFFRNGDASRIRETHARLQSAILQQEHESYELKRLSEKDVEEYQRQQERLRRESFASRNEVAHQQRGAQELLAEEIQQQEHASYEIKWAGERDADAYSDKMAEERRKSLASRNREGSKQRTAISQIRAEEQQAEHESYELKWAGEQDADTYQRSLELQRRESLANRNKEGRRQREYVEHEHSKTAAAEHESFELKMLGEKDADKYSRQMEQQRRESLANRNKEGRRQREFTSQNESDLQQLEHESYELKRAGELDAAAYEKKMAEERRESFAFRNREGHDQREHLAKLESDALGTEHAGYELKWAGEKDAEAYRRKLERERRESFARRNEEKSRHARVMEELTTIAMEKETESFVLKWAGEEDAKKYLAKIEEERRQSLQLRGKEAIHHREVEEEFQREELNKAHADEELRAEDQKNVEGYRKELAERDRASFEYRLKEGRIQRIKEEDERLEQQQIEAEHFQLDTLAQTDVEDYLRDCKDRRRLSLAFRAKEKSRHAQWEKEEAEQEREERSRDVRGRLMDRHYVELARQQERAQSAIDAIRHAGCSFNPFSGVLS